MFHGSNRVVHPKVGGLFALRAKAITFSKDVTTYKSDGFNKMIICASLDDHLKNGASSLSTLALDYNTLIPTYQKISDRLIFYPKNKRQHLKVIHYARRPERPHGATRREGQAVRAPPRFRIAIRRRPDPAENVSPLP